MHSFTASTSGSAILLLLSFGSSAVAQLLGCDAVGCPVDEYRTPQCEIGNATLKAIGITNVTTLLDSQPLTWTLGLQELKAAQPTFDRNFYLGTPPSVNLNDTTSCALFFEGVSSNLTTSAGNQLNKFICSDALPAACISDLLTQAQSSFDNLDKTPSSSSSICTQLRDTLLTKPPPTCNMPQGTWGTILATPLSGSSSPAPLPQSPCHPTTGRNYTLSLIASTRTTTTSRAVSHLGPILNAIHPVMTLVRGANETRAQLSCLKLVEQEAGQTLDAPRPEKGGAEGLGAPAVRWGVGVALAWLFVL
ncbi:hypothetical protein EJ07DRAFT_157552 [Lizonia empirigonia]|nr:hypothetical protein EJ07DRAFT_157552 [Lizonia empirigonia]